MRERLDEFAAGIGELAEGMHHEVHDLPPMSEASFLLAIASLEAAQQHMQMAAYFFSRWD